MGGALSLLWHEKAGPIFAATMNSYQLIEAPNMQTSNRQYLMGGTPRIEMMAGGIAYTNLDDLQAQVSYGMVHDRHRFDVKAHLVDIRQKYQMDRLFRSEYIILYQILWFRLRQIC